MRYLVDTNVLSEARKPRGDARVKGWWRLQAVESLAISVITVLEIDVGIRRLRRRDPAGASALQGWLDGQVLTGFEGRILPVDLACVRAVAPLHVPDPMEEHDAMIAGTALAHGLTVVTRNTRHFERVAVPLLNPWQPEG